jgi:hypothetical protein
MNEMKVLTTIVMRQEDGMLFAHDTVLYQEKLWLVTRWIEGPTPGTERPDRIICLDGLPLQKADPSYRADLLLTLPLNKDTLAGLSTAQNLVVVNQPDVIRTVASIQ